MAKADLINSDDFRAYQKDLERRLEDAVKAFHHILIQPASSWDDAKLRLIKLEGARAVIAELELVIALPSTYLPETNKDAQAKIKKTLAGRFIDIFRSAFRAEEEGEPII